MKCINNKPLEGNEIAPPLIIGENYELKTRYVCNCGQEHWDVGLQSKFNWVSCYVCKNPIPKGDLIHWCHPTRFGQA